MNTLLSGEVRELRCCDCVSLKDGICCNDWYGREMSPNSVACVLIEQPLNSCMSQVDKEVIAAMGRDITLSLKTDASHPAREKIWLSVKTVRLDLRDNYAIDLEAFNKSLEFLKTERLIETTTAISGKPLFRLTSLGFKNLK